jgi:DNA-binding transcriptional regulator YiaG
MATKARRKTSVQAKKKLSAAESVSGRKVQVSTVREGLGLNRKSFSRLTGYSERAIADWESGKELSEASRQRMHEMERLQRALSRVMKDAFIGQWLQTPNDAFTGLKPIEVVERGEIDRVWRMIYELESGMPG